LLDDGAGEHETAEQAGSQEEREAAEDFVDWDFGFSGCFCLNISLLDFSEFLAQVASLLLGRADGAFTLLIAGGDVALYLPRQLGEELLHGLGPRPGFGDPRNRCGRLHPGRYRERNTQPEWQIAAETLLSSVEGSGPLMFAEIAMRKALKARR
jgi:hypothetical protein